MCNSRKYPNFYKKSTKLTEISLWVRGCEMKNLLQGEYGYFLE